MPTTLRTFCRRAGVLLASVLACCLLAGPLSVIFPQAADAATVSDTFDRANGGLGSNWTTTPGTAAPQISGNTLHAGTANSLNSAYWSASTFGNDQFSQGTLPGSSGSNYGPGLAVRLSGTKGYFLWYGNSTNTISLWRMDSATSWTQLKTSGALTVTPATDVWKIQVVGSTISGYQNGNLVVQTTDTAITTGSPGVWLYYAANQIDNWSGGSVTTTGTSYSVGGTVSGLAAGGTVVLEDNGASDLSVTANGAFTIATGQAAGAAYNVTVKTSPAGQTCTVANGTGTVGSANVTSVAVTCTTSGGGGTGGLQVTYTGTDANGVQSYTTLSSEDGGSAQVLRVLPPSSPAAGVKHNFLFVLPVETGQGTTYGDGIGTMETANAQNQYNLTIIEPAFPTDPWYADNPTDASLQYESFMTTQLVPWVRANLSITGTEQNWLIGFSKSGIGGQDLLFRHPDVFSVAASWDFPADMSS